jgi:hypothetical protein
MESSQIEQDKEDIKKFIFSAQLIIDFRHKIFELGSILEKEDVNHPLYKILHLTINTKEFCKVTQYINSLKGYKEVLEEFPEDHIVKFRNLTPEQRTNYHKEKFISINQNEIMKTKPIDEIIEDIQQMFKHIDNIDKLNYWGILNESDDINNIVFAPLACLKCRKTMYSMGMFQLYGPPSNRIQKLNSFPCFTLWFCETDNHEFNIKVLALRKQAEKENRNFDELYKKALEPLTNFVNLLKEDNISLLTKLTKRWTLL